MFYYLLHLYLLLALLLMPVLYFPCRAFANFQRTSKQAWVRYF
ncbi:hypothetical protein O0882_13890 [Janthinobacterium sp. SUN073]|nr:hypothetical protein [Janthinobacterium sp. SUN073]MDN2697410.1 hypothetical protein [Janthinobacterium sp. SUN073]